ncbi:MAG: CaiB/BaiF CoA-transferase family protein [Pseudomonadota bacterium]
MSDASGPLKGLKILEMAGIGPGPFVGMMLADHGADVTRIERPGGNPSMGAFPPGKDILMRSRKAVAVDIRTPQGIEQIKEMAAQADALFEGFRPGVMEKRGLGPDVLLHVNPKLVYGRITGWGQSGPLAQTAGHDINYIALTGALAAIGGPATGPIPPLNLVGDFGGGAMMLAFGMLAALLHVKNGGDGQVVDAAMVDGASLLMSMMHSFHHLGLWQEERSSNLLDGGAPFYRTYETSDGHFMAVGAIEPQFYMALLQGLELTGDPALFAQMDRSAWPHITSTIAQRFLAKTRDEWTGTFSGTDACVTPVLTMEEAPSNPHMAARHAFLDVGAQTHPMPTPRYYPLATTGPTPGSRPIDEVE